MTFHLYEQTQAASLYFFSLSANDENVDSVSFLILIPSLPDIRLTQKYLIYI
jgi:hypothetical protein